MDKNAIKKFAVWARKELIARVSLKGVEYGITEDDIVDAAADSVGGKVLTGDEKKQRMACIAEIKNKGYKQVMEEVAYTWFNRFCALRFMEANGCLPSHVRVFTDEENNFKPQIIAEAIHLDLDGLDKDKVFALKEAEKTEELYKYLLIVQCNALNKSLPGMFQKIADYTELLLPDNLLREGSIIQQMIELIPEEDWKDAVQIIGWLYQYYNSEKKDDVFAALKKNIKITKENIPAATQLFTPDWIVRYMVENSLGRLWIEGHPNDELKSQWKYYLEEAQQEPEVQVQLAEIRKEYAALTPEQIKVIDPCCGSGHILAYMFDVLMQIYEAYGYTTREAVASIVENNIYGLDIDDRAAQLTYFAVMMKAYQYDRRFFRRGIQPHVYAIVESGHTDKDGIKHKNYDEYALEYFVGGDEKLKAAMDTIISELHDAKEYGSILTVTPQDWSALYGQFAEIDEDINMARETALRELLPLVQVAEALAQKYDVVVTNPPYMGASNMNNKVLDFIKKNYTDYKADFFSAFIVRCIELAKEYGRLGFLSPYVWMFIFSYEKLRALLLNSKALTSLIQFEYSAFEEAIVPICTFTFLNAAIDYRGSYIRLTDFKGGLEVQKEKTLFAISNHECGYYYETETGDFMVIPGTPISYWQSKSFFEMFREKNMSDIVDIRKGMTTADNRRFLRFWWEVSMESTNIRLSNTDSSKWFKTHKGGDYRKWYGNSENLVNWEKNGFELKAFSGSVIRNEDYYLRECISWNDISSAKAAFRYVPRGSISNASGPSFYGDSDKLYYLVALCNSKVTENILTVLCPTIHFEIGQIAKVPVKYQSNGMDIIEKAKSCIELSKQDWDSFETSWDFQQHSLVRCKSFSPEEVAADAAHHMVDMNYIREAFTNWSNECYLRFDKLKANEEELNRIFIDIYGLQDELAPEVEDKDVTVRKADLGRDIRSFISYAVGCMFGRYSLDKEGLIYAGGEWDASRYASFPADKDNIIPICDDEYFADDIVSRFVEFVKVVYGEETLDDNLKFIADALGGKGQPKEVIRNYFLNDFFNDHCKIYQKRPIYWLFDSGKKNGFKALIYMHRYQPDTIARIRTDYVHEQQARYRTAIEELEKRIESAATSERVKLNKKLTTLQAQDAEIRTYEEKIHHLADQMISIDLDDGVKHNYAIFQDVLAKIK